MNEIKNLFIHNSTFRNLFGNSTDGGGALMIGESSNVNKIPENKVQIRACLFLNSTNLNGGALSLLDTANVIIDQGTKFIGNYASQQGGAVYFYCSNYGSRFDMCSLTLSNVTFENNLAD